MRLHPAFAGFILAALASGCAEMQKSQDAAPKPAAPQITEGQLRERANAQLQQGVTQYQAGDYDNAMKSLTSSLDHGLLSKADQSRARKVLAFIHCVSGRENLCRDEFRKAFEINPDFSLSTAEDGHPIWGPIYRDVRTQLITEREAAQARTRTFIPLAKPEQMLADGIVKYDAGDYDSALKLLEGSLKEGLKDKSDQVRAMKHVAFSLCLKEKFRDCRAAFVKIYDVDPAFDLTPAEAGHPSWTKTFASAKAHAHRLQKEKAQREAKEKSKAPPAASVPAKK
jgi:tetratricopeptide (TPR) repeat protein